MAMFNCYVSSPEGTNKAFYIPRALEYKHQHFYVYGIIPKLEDDDFPPPKQKWQKQNSTVSK